MAMKLFDHATGQVSVDFSFRYATGRGKDTLIRAIFCDGTDEWILEGDRKVDRDGTAIKLLDVTMQCNGQRIRLKREQSRKLWDFLQMNGYRAVL